jgi:hypothetical protein
VTADGAGTRPPHARRLDPGPALDPPVHPRQGGHTLAILGGLLLVIGLALLPDLGPAGRGDATIRLDHGRITAIGQADPETGAQPASVLLLDGPHTGETVTADLEASGPRSLSAPYAVGDEVVVQVSLTPDGEFVAVSDRWRLPLLAWLLGRSCSRAGNPCRSRSPPPPRSRS